MKDRFVGTVFGRMLLRARSYASLRSIPFANPEQAAATSNAILADRLIIGLCEGKATFLDVGAHIGSVFSAVHQAFPDMRILAIEADPEKASSLRERFSYCSVHETAVGEETGPASFFLCDDRPGFSSLDNNVEGTREVLVNIDTLDILLPDETVDIIKIDIEGAELGALRGGVNLLERSRPVIMFESAGTGENSLGYSAEGLWRFFDDHRFSIFLPDRLAHDAPALSLDTFLDAHHYPTRSVNFFAVPRERRLDVRDAARSILGIVP